VQISTAELESTHIDRTELRDLVESIMDALERYCSSLASTPGGAGWLHVQHVPVRRFVAEIVRKLLALNAWEPFAAAPGLPAPAPKECLIGLRTSSAQEYLAYTVTWSGIAYLLGSTTPHNPGRSSQLEDRFRVRCLTSDPSPLLTDLRQRDVVALSWSSRHSSTLVPVLAELEQVGHTSLLLDLATDSDERCTMSTSAGIGLHVAPGHLLTTSGIDASLSPSDSGYLVRVGRHGLRLARLVRLLSVLLETSGGCTQPSWGAVVRVESWLDGVLASTRPHTVLLSNDTSPLGVLAVHMAERHRANTVHVQHGAWSADSVSWPALHSRDIAVMGERDLPLAQAWARHPQAEVHVVGQPRFDTLARLDRQAQREFLVKLLSFGNVRVPTRIVVWACQPFSPDHLKIHASLLLDGLTAADGDWGLVIASHPAQDADALAALLTRDEGPLVAIVNPGVGARGCLAGADALASAYSTCGIEAALLDIPVLEIGAPGERTLDLASYGLATRCHNAGDITQALSAVRHPGTPVPKATADAVCRWRGDSAAQVARLITRRAQTTAGSSAPVYLEAAFGASSSPPRTKENMPND
jgi:hypothetical protein